MKRKVLVTLLAFAMIFAISVPAFAANDEPVDEPIGIAEMSFHNSTDGDVIGSDSNDAAAAAVAPMGFAAMSLPINTGNNVTSFTASDAVTADGKTSANLVAVWNGGASKDLESTISFTGNTGAVSFGSWVINPSTTGTIPVTIGQVCTIQNVVFALSYPNGKGVPLTANVIVLAREHNYVGFEDTPAWCETEGLMTYTCSFCGDSYEETIDALEHDYDEEVTGPACEVDGFTTYTCSLCKDSFIMIDEGSALGHNFDNIIRSKDATCVREGYVITACVNGKCEAKNRETTAEPLGHSTCKERIDGEWYDKCTRCCYSEKTNAPAIKSISASAKSIVSIVETQKNIWTLTFIVNITYENGEVITESFVETIAKNSDGKINFDSFTLIYDIKGNGSNIKEFSVFMN